MKEHLSLTLGCMMRFLLLLVAAAALKPLSLVKPGAVVLAPSGEYNHFLRQASVLILNHGDEGTIGVNLGSPTLLTIGEAADVITGDLGENRLWMGGEHGGRGAVMVHAVPGLEGAKQIGESELFVGGVKQAQQLVDDGTKMASDFKFFFNVAKWPKDQLQGMVDEGRWLALEAPVDVVLDQAPDLDVQSLWSSLRKQAIAALAQDVEDVVDVVTEEGGESDSSSSLESASSKAAASKASSSSSSA